VDWILLISLQWVVMGSPVPPSTQQLGPFASERLCHQAAEAIQNEMGAPVPGQRVLVFAKTVCFALSEAETEKTPTPK
jgi:hypothetical protein